MTTPSISIIDRKTHKTFQEHVWGESALHFLYGETWVAKILGRSLLHALIRWPICSWIVGLWYNSSKSRRMIQPFCEKFSINMVESELNIEEFASFNEFFTRPLKPSCRPIDAAPCIAPADGRYSFIHTLDEHSILSVKEEDHVLATFVGDPAIASRYHMGTAILCRLCPTDCHRFYFPMDGTIGTTTWIQGSLFSVSPFATRTRPWIWWKNRRTRTLLKTPHAGTVAYIEIGATNCGSIVQTFTPNTSIRKGDEKGYFRLGASAIVLLFEPGRLIIDDDIISLSRAGHEIYCQRGSSLGSVHIYDNLASSAN